jgi:glycosyltransferase 2 family protein
LVAAVCALFIVARWRHGDFDWPLFARTVLSVRWPWLVAAVLVSLATYFGRALRWAVLIRHVKPNPSLWGLSVATAIGFTAVVLLGRPGELVRPYLIAAKEKVSFSSQLAAWLLERICDLLCALLIFAIALVEVDRSGAKVGPALQWALEAGGYFVGIIGVFSVVLLVFLRQFSDTARRRLVEAFRVLPDRWRCKAEELLGAFLQGLEATKTRAGLFGIFWYSLLEWSLIVLCYVTLFRAFPALVGLRLADVLILIGFVAFGSLVQIPGIGGGMQVVAIVVLTEIFKIPLEEATGLALAVWVVTFVAVVPVGAVLAIHEGLNWQKLRAMEDGYKP